LYERQRTGLGDKFMDSVQASLEAILKTPSMHAVVYRQYRRRLIARFPYAIFYEAEDDRVIVNCVFHTMRNPEKWRERLP
jgi:plasmid stabilization system protein ParE